MNDNNGPVFLRFHHLNLANKGKTAFSGGLSFEIGLTPCEKPQITF